MRCRRFIVLGCVRGRVTVTFESGEVSVGEICGEVWNARQPNRLNINSPETHLLRGSLI